MFKSGERGGGGRGNRELDKKAVNGISVPARNERNAVAAATTERALCR